MNYSLSDMGRLQALSSQMNRAATELAMLKIYSDSNAAIEGRESELEELFGQIHAIMLGDMSDADADADADAGEGVTGDVTEV